MRRMIALSSVMAAVLLLAVPTVAWAYVGPGSGMTVIGAAIAFLAGIVLAIIGFVWYPIKRLLGLRSKSDTADRQSEM